MAKAVFRSQAMCLTLAFLMATVLPGASASAQSHSTPPGQFALDVYALRGSQDTSAKLYLSVICKETQTVTEESFDSVNVQVSTQDGHLISDTDHPGVSSAAGPAIIDLGDIPLSDVVRVHAKGSAGPNAVRVTLNGQTAVTEFAANPTRVVVPAFEGFGAQMNGYVYTALNDPTRGFVGNEPPEDMGNLESKVIAMHPGLVRIFLSPAAYLSGNQNLMDSTYKTVELAQRAGADINITWWFIDRAPKDDPVIQQQLMQQDMQEFASTLEDMVVNHGITHLQQITIQNEVDTSWVTPALYEQYYRLLDQYLRAAGVRKQIKFVGGDLVINNQQTWFDYMAAHMGDVLDGWSVHIYWNYWDTAYMQSRLSGILAIYNSIPADERKPLSVTEYGVRGIKTLNGKKIMDSDPYRGGALTATLAGYYEAPDGSITPVNETDLAAYEQAWFNMLSVNDGFVGMSKWDFYRAQYDFTYQDHSLIGYLFNAAPGQDRWPLRPSYNMEWLMANTTGQHWQVLGQSGSSAARLITPFRGPHGELTIFAMSTDQAAGTVTIGDLPRDTEFRVLIWNGNGDGKVAEGAPICSGGSGTVSVSTPAGGMVALTTLRTAPPPR